MVQEFRTVSWHQHRISSIRCNREKREYVIIQFSNKQTLMMYGRQYT